MKTLLKTLKRPRYAITAAVILIILGIIISRVIGAKKEPYQTQIVTRGSVVQEVDATGKVKPAEAVDLGFVSGGKIANIRVKVGDKVNKGEVLMSLENADKAASLASAKANYNKLINGATSQNLNVSQTALERTKADLSNAIQSVYTKTDNLIRTDLDKFFASPTSNSPQFGISFFDTSSNSTVTLTPSDTNQSLSLDFERFKIGTLLASWRADISASSTLDIDSQAARSIQYLSQIKTFVGDIANAVNAIYLNQTKYQSNLDTVKADVAAARNTVDSQTDATKSAQESVKTASANLVLTAAPARTEDIEIQQAAVNAAAAEYAKTIIVAPFTGLITKIVPEKGEIVSGATPVISMISASNLEVEVFIPEADIPKVKVGDEADITFDAYGKDFVATSTVVSIDPAATVIENVPTYRTLLTFSQSDPRIKTGMTANIIIHGERRDDVITVPQRAVITTDGNKFVEVVVNGKIVNRPVTTGLRGSEGNIEIQNGLNEGEQFIPSPAAK